LNAKLRILDGRLAVHATPGQWTICVQIRMHARPGSNFEVSEAISLLPWLNRFDRPRLIARSHCPRSAVYLTIAETFRVVTSFKEVMFSPVSVCLSVIQYNTNSISSSPNNTPTVDRGRITQSVSVNRISQKLMIKSLWNCIKRLNIIEGPNRLCFEWLLPTQGQGCKRSKGKKTFLRITSFKVLVESRNKN